MSPLTLLYADAYAPQIIDDLIEDIRALAQPRFQSLRSPQTTEPLLLL